MLEVNQLTRSYGSTNAVDNVSFSVGKGEIVGLLGHNGAGKTTIMRMISGYLEPDRGTVWVDGVNLATDPKRIQASLGYLPENLPVYPELTVADYLDYAADLKGLTGDTKRSEIVRVMDATDITPKLLSTIATLSRGYKQRLGVAQAILGRPSLLILDEPTNGLDPEQTQRMRDLICELAKDATIILSTHIMQEVDALCSRVLILRSGELALDADLDDMRRSNHLLLESSLPPNSAELILLNIDGVASVQPLDTKESGNYCNTVRITLHNDVNARVACASIARTIIQLQEQLYRLTPETRDLEALFRQVNDRKYRPEGLSHAA